MAAIPAEVLIPLVEQKRILWDKNMKNYKVKRLRLAAWREICLVLNPNFESLDEKERKEYRKIVATKWINIRDAYTRARKNKMKRLSLGAKTTRPYVFKEQLKFLLTIKDSEKPQETGKVTDKITEKVTKVTPQTRIVPVYTPQVPHGNLSTACPLAEIEMRLKDKENPYLSFIKGVLPSLASFDEDETLEFQSGVLALIQKIKRKREDNLYGPYTHFACGYQNLKPGYFPHNNNCEATAEPSTTLDLDIKQQPPSPTPSNCTLSSNSNTFEGSTH